MRTATLLPLGRRFLVSAVKAALTIILLGVALQTLALTLGFPTVAEICSAVVRQAKSGTLGQDIFVSLSRWAIGFSLGTTAGIACGLFTGRVHFARFTFEGLFVFCRGIPFIALLPLTLFVFGIEESGKFFLIGWVACTVSWIIVHDAAKNISDRIDWRLQVLNISRFKKLFSVIIPTIHKEIMTAIRASLSLALIAVAVVEMSGVYERSTGRWWSEGIGNRIFRSYDVGDLATMMASVVIMALIGLLLDQFFRVLWNEIARLRENLLEKKVRRLVGLLDSGNAHVYADSTETLSICRLFASYCNVPVIENVTFTIPAGTTLSIVGQSGCGKTTLMRSIGHFMSANFTIQGEVKIGHEILTRPCAKIGVVFQGVLVFEHMTVWDNAMLGVPHPSMSDKERVCDMLHRFDLLNMAHTLAADLSGGQKQRLAIASALAYRPTILLLDEPFGALDAITRRSMQEFYSENVRGGITALFITHDIDEALLIGDLVRIGTRADARVFLSGTNMKPGNREFTSEFTAQKKLVADALRAEYNRSK